jgi:hypothetical protein
MSGSWQNDVSVVVNAIRVADRMITHKLFAIFFARRAFEPIPAGWLATFPSGAFGTTTCAAWAGLWSGRIGAEMGESLGVVVADIASSEKVTEDI